MKGKGFGQFWEQLYPRALNNVWQVSTIHLFMNKWIFPAKLQIPWTEKLVYGFVYSKSSLSLTYTQNGFHNSDSYSAYQRR